MSLKVLVVQRTQNFQQTSVGFISRFGHMANITTIWSEKPINKLQNLTEFHNAYKSVALCFSQSENYENKI